MDISDSFQGACPSQQEASISGLGTRTFGEQQTGSTEMGLPREQPLSLPLSGEAKGLQGL